MTVDEDGRLPESTRKFMLHIVEVLRGGFTGRIEIECSEGGIRELRKTERLTTKDLPQGDERG